MNDVRYVLSVPGLKGAENLQGCHSGQFLDCDDIGFVGFQPANGILEIHPQIRLVS